MTRIPFDECFDAVIASHVLEHIEDDRTAIAELFRILRPGGRAILIIPEHFEAKEDFSITSARGRFIAFGQIDHVRLYGPEFGDRLQAAGFHVVRDVGDWLDEESAARFGVPRGEPVYHGVRPPG